MMGRISMEHDEFVQGKGCEVTPRTTRYNVSVNKKMNEDMLEWVSSAYDAEWNSLDGGGSTTAYEAEQDDGKIRLRPTKVFKNKPKKNYSIQELMCVGYFKYINRQCSKTLMEDISVEENPVAYNTQVDNINKVYMRLCRQIKRAIRFDILSEADVSRFNQSLFGRVRVHFINMLIYTLVHLTLYGFCGSPTLKNLLLTNTESILQNESPGLPTVVDGTDRYFDGRDLLPEKEG